MARGTLLSELRSVADDPEALLAYVEPQGWGDGLPGHPADRGRACRRCSTRRRSRPRTSSASSSRGAARRRSRRSPSTRSSPAAGPDYFPAVLAAVEAVCEPRFNLYALNTTTCCATPALMINGPARQRARHRVRLLVPRPQRPRQRDHRPCAPPRHAERRRLDPRARSASRSSASRAASRSASASGRSGARGRRSTCAAASPPTESVVTAICATGTQDIADIFAETGEELVWVLAHSIDWIGNNKVLVPQDKGDMLLLLCPDFAHKIARDGIDVPHDAADAPRVDADADRALAPRPTGRSSSSSATSTATSCRSRRGPEQFLIAVAGGESGHHALYFCTFGLTWSVSRRVRGWASRYEGGEVVRAARPPGLTAARDRRVAFAACTPRGTPLPYAARRPRRDP